MVTMSKDYKKRCSTCQTEIIMSDASGKWSAFETDSIAAHRCKKQAQIQTQAQAQTITAVAATSPTTTKSENSNSNLPVRYTNEEKITALENRIATIENWIKKVSDSCNHIAINCSKCNRLACFDVSILQQKRNELIQNNIHVNFVVSNFVYYWFECVCSCCLSI